MTRPVAGINRVFIYRLTSPILMAPWVWTQFFASAISWGLLALYAVWGWNSTILWVPTWTLGAFFVLVPFQQSQVPMIRVLEYIGQNIDDFINDTLWPIIEDILYIFQPGCWGYNFLWDGIITIFRIGIYDPVKKKIAMLVPVDPLGYFKQFQISATAFPVSTEIDTSNTPDWIVGCYGRSIRGTADDPRCEHHRLMDGSRQIYYQDDEYAEALIRWIAKHHEHEPEAKKRGIVKLVIHPETLDIWTHPNTPLYKRKAISEQLLRREMDRSINLETPSTWELSLMDQERIEQETMAKGYAGASPWAKVFDIPETAIRGGGMGIVRLDAIPNLVEEYGYERAGHIKVPPGSVAYRFLADNLGTRDLSFSVLQKVCEVFNSFFDTVITVLVQLWNIALTVADALFSDIENFFSDAISFVANVFNQVWREFLDLPCLKFDSVEVFAISLLDCICGPLTQAAKNFFGGNIGRWFNYTRPTQIKDLPQAILGCVGLGCINITVLVNHPNAFASQLLGECMNLPDSVVCCIINPINCFKNTVMKLSSCPCGGKVDVTLPNCNYPTNNNDSWLKCIVMWLMNNMFSKAGSNSCQISVTDCSSLSLSTLSNKFVTCVALSVLKVPEFINALVPLLKDIFHITSSSGIFSLHFRENKYPALISNKRSTRSNLLLDEAEDSGTSRNSGDDLYEKKKDSRLSFLTDGPWVGSTVANNYGGGHSAESGSEQRMSARLQGRVNQILSSPNVVINSNYSTLSALGGNDDAVSQQNRTELIAMMTKKYGEDGTKEFLRLEEEARMQERIAFYEDADPSNAELDTYRLRDYADTRTYDKQPFIRQLSHMVGKTSRSRQRATLQAKIDRRVYNNPYIGKLASRAWEIVRDLIDFAEFRTYGPDPFAQPPRDADPERDPRIFAARYVDESQSHNHAYSFYEEAMKENPYYAGLYKVMFQLGDPSALGRDVTAEYNTTSNSTTIHDTDSIWQIMGIHANNPLFHMGRLMAASRQLLYAYRLTLNQVWWDSDSFNFHFPNFVQIRSLMMQSHIPAYSDDMRAAIAGLFQAESLQAHEELIRRSTEYTDELFEDPTSANLRYGSTIQTYSWMVQAEVAIRSVATRLLSPRHLEPMLDELSTRSPIHARYCFRMRNRVEALRDASDRAHLELEEKIEAWRAQLGGTMTIKDWNETRSSDQTRDGEPIVVNRPLVDLDKEAHPDAGQRELMPGERVRFADGKTGVYMGTIGSESVWSPTRIGKELMQRDNNLSGRWVGTEGIGFAARGSVIIAMAKGFIKVIQFCVNHWRLIATGFFTAASSPWGRVFWESWFVFIYNRIIKPLYTEGLEGIFGSLYDVLLLVFDFQILNETIFLFLLTEIFRYTLCYGWVALIYFTVWEPISIISGILSFGILKPVTAILGWVILILGFMFPYCPPEQVLEDNKLTVIFYQYIDEIIQCFGDPDIHNIHIGKAVYNGICSVPSDCPGNAPCICENKGGQYNSAWASFVDNTPCGTVAAPTGQCLCWPKLDCQFLFPRIGLSNLFETDCADVYGYHLNEITWYQTSAYFKIFFNAYQNFWNSLHYVTRKLTSAPRINPFLWMLMVCICFLILFYANFYAGIGLLVLVMGEQYALPLWKRLTISHIIPGLNTVKGKTFWPITVWANWMLSFLRWGNYTDAHPLGSEGNGEAVCWFFNLATFLGGGSVAFWFWATVVALLWYGFGPIIWFVFNNLMIPLRMLYAPVWFYWQKSRMKRHFDRAKDMVKENLPDWMKTAGSELYKAGNYVLEDWANKPLTNNDDKWLHKWLNKVYPNPAEAWKLQMLGPEPVHIDGSVLGYGGGVLDHEIEDAQKLRPTQGAAPVTVRRPTNNASLVRPIRHRRRLISPPDMNRRTNKSRKQKKNKNKKKNNSPPRKKDKDKMS